MWDDASAGQRRSAPARPRIGGTYRRSMETGCTDTRRRAPPHGLDPDAAASRWNARLSGLADSGPCRYTMSAQCMRSSDVWGRSIARGPTSRNFNGALVERSISAGQSRTATIAGAAASTAGFSTVSILAWAPQVQSCGPCPGAFSGPDPWWPTGFDDRSQQPPRDVRPCPRALSSCRASDPVRCVLSVSAPHDPQPLRTPRRSQQQKGTASARISASACRNGPIRFGMIGGRSDGVILPPSRAAVSPSGRRMK